MSIDKELQDVADAIRAEPVPLAPEDVAMIRGLIARVEAMELIVKYQRKDIEALQAEVAKLKAA